MSYRLLGLLLYGLYLVLVVFTENPLSLSFTPFLHVLHFTSLLTYHPLLNFLKFQFVSRPPSLYDRQKLLKCLVSPQLGRKES